MINQYAVILLHEKLTDSLILTKRSVNLHSHPGEFCFPGGQWEEGDRTLWSTALRELYEEIGIASERVTLIKSLKPVSTLAGRDIYPWMASITSLHPFALNREEVDSILQLPMDSVMNIRNYQEIVVQQDKKKITSCQFTASKALVWGATAKIMQQLCIQG